MSYEVQVRRAAELDIAEAQVWYEMHQAGLGNAFQLEISQVIERLSTNPTIYQVVHRDVRRAIVHRFPYLIWYRLASTTVVILACTHARGNPDSVKAR